MNPSISNASLKNWAASVRGAYRRGELLEDYVQALEALPGWSWGMLRKTADEWVRVAEQRAANNGGKLECGHALLRLGLGGLVQMMKKYPDKFRHIEQDVRWTTATDWVSLAEERARRNHGFLEHVGWLMKHGLGALVQSMRKHPEMFAHIAQNKPYAGRKSVQDWVRIAEQRVRDNGGLLESSGWLQSHGFNNLVQAMCKRPELFAHIKMEKAYTSGNEWVALAERLAKENGGTLDLGSLRRSGNGSLRSFIASHPELFAHIPQQEPFRSTEDWVAFAEERARSNDGRLESNVWLKEHGLARLILVMQQNRDRFAHIEQEGYVRKPMRAVSEIVSTAEQRARRNGGALECPQWLEKHELGYLVRAMAQQPEMFNHIPQERYTGKTLVAIRGGGERGKSLARKLGLKHEAGYKRAIAEPRSKEEWVRVAEKIAREHGGRIPCPDWLIRHHWGGLQMFIKRNRQLVRHLVQEIRYHNGKLLALRGGGNAGKKLAAELGVPHKI